MTKTLNARAVAGFILTIALGAVFLLSGISKLDSLKSFSWSVIDVLPVPELWAGVVARIIVSTELMVGAFLVLHLALRSFTYRAALALLVLFTVYLTVSVFRQGNAGNCGCFGNWLSMTPGAAIFKNLVMIAALIVCYAIYRPRGYKHAVYAGALMATAAFVTPFVHSPVYINEEEEFKKETVNLNPLYESARPFPTVELRTGKHIIGLFSLTCPHCKHAGERMQELYSKDSSLALYAVLSGPPDELQTFLKDSKVTTLPYTVLTDGPAFEKMAGKYVPQVYWMNNGVRVRRMYYSDLKLKEIKSWLSQN